MNNLFYSENYYPDWTGAMLESEENELCIAWIFSEPFQERMKFNYLKITYNLKY